MDIFCALSLLSLAGVFFVHSKTKRTSEYLNSQVDRLCRRMERLEGQLGQISPGSIHRAVAVERSVDSVGSQQTSEGPIVAGHDPGGASEIRHAGLVSEAEKVVPDSVPPPPPTASLRPPFVENPEAGASAPTDKNSSHASPMNWEQFMGVRLFAWLGGLALFLAAAFFVKYSFDNDLIAPELRVAIGFVTGTVLLAIGCGMPRTVYRVTADTLCAAGMVILYAVTFTCHSIYAFPHFGPLLTFLVMCLITTVAFVSAVRLNAQVVAVLGMLGGFLTPVLVASNSADAVGLFSYLALLDLGLVAVSVSRRWDWLNVGAVLGTSVFQILWMVNVFDASETRTALAIFLGFSLLYFCGAGYARARGAMNHWLAGAAAVPPLLTLVFVLLHLDRSLLGGQPGLIYLFLVVADLCLLGLAVLSARLRNLPVLGGGLTFLILAVWTVGVVDFGMMYWALGGYVGFALLYTVFPILVRRRWSDIPLSPYSHLFPAFALLMMLVPLFTFEVESFFVWPFIMLLDILAFGVAVALASVAGIVVALLITVGIAIAWFFSMPAEIMDVSQALMVIIGMVVVFEGGLLWALRSIVAKRAATPASDGGLSSIPGWLRSAERLETQLPALSAVLPFLLLILMTIRLPLTSPLPVYGAALLLGALLLGMTRFAAMDWLPPLGLACSLLLQLTWLGVGVNASTAQVSLYWAVGFYALYLLYPFVFLRGKGARWLAWVTAALSGPAHFLVVYPLIAQYWSTACPGLVPLAFALPSLIGLALVKRQLSHEQPKRLTILAWFGGVFLLFVTLIFPIQFEREWLTLAWAFEAAALLWLFQRVPHPGLRYTAIGLATLAFVRLTLNAEVLGYFPGASTPLLNGFLYTYGLVALALVIGARFVRAPHHLMCGKDVRGILIGMATILIFILINIEIADFFRRPEQNLVRIQFGVSFAQDVAYTIAWGLFSLLLVVVGIFRGLRVARYAGIGLMAVTLFKLFFYDLASLSQLYRVGALVGVSIIAMLASLLYQRFFAGQTRELGEGSVSKDPEA